MRKGSTRRSCIRTGRSISIHSTTPQVIGGLGLIGSKAAYEAVRRCEAFIMIGSDYPYSEFLPQKAQVIQIDERAAAIGRRLPVSQAIVGSTRPSVAALLASVKSKTDDAFCVRVQQRRLGLVHLEMEEATLPVFKGAGMKNPDFAMFAKACGGCGFRVSRPEALRETVALALATPGPVIVDVIVDPAEIPSMSHINVADAWKFGIGKIRELAS